MKIEKCPKCGKQPIIKFDEAAYYTGWGAWYTIQCKPTLRKTHLKIEEGKADKEQCLKYAIKHWNEKVLKMKGNTNNADI